MHAVCREFFQGLNLFSSLSLCLSPEVLCDPWRGVRSVLEI